MEIAEATVPSLAMVPETLRVLGFAIIRNFKKVSSDDVNALYDTIENVVRMKTHLLLDHD